MPYKNHHSHRSQTHCWFTPPEIVQELGPFDLDPASQNNRPWDTATHHFTPVENGLLQNWFGRVWLNPPFDSQTLDAWMEKMSAHNHGISILHARTDRNTWHNFIFQKADSILFIKQRIHYYSVDGVRAPKNSGAPSALIAYGEYNSDRLAECSIKGHHQILGRVSVMVMSIDRSWRVVVKTVLVKLNEACVDEVYKEVENMVPGKVRANTNYKAKIRQMLQRHGKRIKKGVYTI